MPKILTVTGNAGSGQSILPVINRLNNFPNFEVTSVVYDVSDKVFDRACQDYNKIEDLVKGCEHPTFQAMESIIQEVQPHLVLTGTSTPGPRNRYLIEQTTTIAAQRNGVPVVTVLDFWTEYLAKFGGDIGFPVYPDRIALPDENAKKEMLAIGAPAGRLYVTGNPHFDQFPRLAESFTQQDKERVRRELGLRPDSHLLTFISQPIAERLGNRHGYTEKTVLLEVFKALQDINPKNATLLVKAHPNEKQEDLVQMTRQYNFPVLVDQKYDTTQAVLASDIVLGMFSTVLLDALCMGKPSLSIEPGLKGRDPLITNQLEITPHVYNAEKIAPTLQTLISDSSSQEAMATQRKRFLKEAYVGKATERVTSLVYDMLKSSQ